MFKGRYHCLIIELDPSTIIEETVTCGLLVSGIAICCFVSYSNEAEVVTAVERATVTQNCMQVVQVLAINIA